CTPPRLSLFPYTTLFRSRLIGDAIKASLQIALAAQSDDLVSHFAIFEDQHCGNRPNPILTGQALVVIDVDFADFHPAVIFAGERSEEHTSELQSLRHLVC